MQKTKFGNFVRSLRVANSLSQQQVADKLGVAENTVQNWVSIHASILKISAQNGPICSNANINIRKMQHVNDALQRSNLTLTYNIILLKSIGFSHYPATNIVTHFVTLRIDT